MVRALNDMFGELRTAVHTGTLLDAAKVFKWGASVHREEWLDVVHGYLIEAFRGRQFFEAPGELRADTPIRDMMWCVFGEAHVHHATRLGDEDIVTYTYEPSGYNVKLACVGRPSLRNKFQLTKYTRTKPTSKYAEHPLVALKRATVTSRMTEATHHHVLYFAQENDSIWAAFDYLNYRLLTRYGWRVHNEGEKGLQAAGIPIERDQALFSPVCLIDAELPAGGPHWVKLMADEAMRRKWLC